MPHKQDRVRSLPEADDFLSVSPSTKPVAFRIGLSKKRGPQGYRCSVIWWLGVGRTNLPQPHPLPQPAAAATAEPRMASPMLCGQAKKQKRQSLLPAPSSRDLQPVNALCSPFHGHSTATSNTNLRIRFPLLSKPIYVIA